MSNAVSDLTAFPDAEAALRRAAARAQIIAIQTGTPLVIWRNGRVEKVPPSALPLVDMPGSGPTSLTTDDSRR